MTHEEKYNKLLEYIHAKIDSNFDYDIEHWDNGNFDDSYEYGIKTGEQYAYYDVLRFSNLLKKEESND